MNYVNVAGAIFTLTAQSVPASLPEICREYSPELKIITLKVYIRTEFSHH
jgi:hypothetical protein